MFWKFRNIFLINFIPRRESTRAEPEGVHSSILFFNKAPEGNYESTPVWGPIDFPFKLLSIPSVNEKWPLLFAAAILILEFVVYIYPPKGSALALPYGVLFIFS